MLKTQFSIPSAKQNSRNGVASDVRQRRFGLIPHRGKRSLRDDRPTKDPRDASIPTTWTRVQVPSSSLTVTYTRL